MQFLELYIRTYSSESEPDRRPLATFLQQAKASYDSRSGGNILNGFAAMVDAYNRIGREKQLYDLEGNALRNLTGAILQDFVMSLAYELIRDYNTLDVFSEVSVALGLYPLWTPGNVKYEPVVEKSDLAVGRLWDAKRSVVLPTSGPWPRPTIFKVPRHHAVLPLITISSKIRVSKPEFFDFLGRSQLMGKGNPHCLNLQVALRKEMVISIIEIAQVHDRFFLLGQGSETSVVPNTEELERLIEVISEHLESRVGNEGPTNQELEAELESPIEEQGSDSDS